MSLPEEVWAGVVGSCISQRSMHLLWPLQFRLEPLVTKLSAFEHYHSPLRGSKYKVRPLSIRRVSLPSHWPGGGLRPLTYMFSNLFPFQARIFHSETYFSCLMNREAGLFLLYLDGLFLYFYFFLLLVGTYFLPQHSRKSWETLWREQPIIVIASE